MFCVAAGASCASHRVQSRETTTSSAETRTTVKATADLEVARNPYCEAYCKRTAECWYAVPHANPMLSKDEVLARCLSEQRGCLTATTEAHCCEAIEGCQDFVACAEKGRDVPSDCRSVLGR
jgi:hypothetical protein